MQIHWLFIGGPADGKTEWVDGGIKQHSVYWPDVTGKNYHYKGGKFYLWGKFYRIGYLNEEDVCLQRIAQLIFDMKLQPIEILDLNNEENYVL